MAIATSIPGLEVTIEVDGQPLPEHDYDQAHDDNLEASSVKYIKAVSGAEFSIRYLIRPPFAPPSQLQMDIVLDDNYIQAPFSEWVEKDGCEGYLFSKASVAIGGQDFTRAFRFSELRTEESTSVVTEEVKQRLAPIGKIVLYFYFVADVKVVELANTAPHTLHELDVVSEKALHKVYFKSGDFLTHQTSLGAPELRAKATYSEVQTTTNEPFAVFTFYYRSEALLKSLGIIPRTPSPSPEPEPEEKDLNDMTPEEMRAELQRMREQRQLVKRERDYSVGTAVDDDEVEWLGTQPSEEVQKKAKKARRSPNTGDEVVDLDD